MSLKRTGSSSIESSSSLSRKRAKVETNNAHLTDWLSSKTLKVPELIVCSEEIVDKDSTFLAHAASITSSSQADVFRRHIRESHAEDPAGHEILAYRVMSVKAGKDGAESEDNWIVKTGQDDDGEKYAASKVLKVMEEQGSIDVACVVSRWFGGTLLGPARFQHIANVTSSALQRLKAADELHESLQQLKAYDDEILCILEKLDHTNASPGKTPDYSKTNIQSAKRLLSARQQRIAHLNKMLASKEETTLEQETAQNEEEDQTEADERKYLEDLEQETRQ